MTTARYDIHTSQLELRAYSEALESDGPGAHWGFARTLQAAIKRGEKLTDGLRSDVHVYILHGGRVVAHTAGIASQGPTPREITPITTA